MLAEQETTPIAVSIDTAARLIEMSPKTVLTLINTGRLPATRIGRTWRVRIADLHALVGGKAVTQ
jgi:excisionase family DNA binding protein